MCIGHFIQAGPEPAEGPEPVERVEGMTKMEIIAHRGASFDAPENTLSAIGMAWQRGADAVEIDIHMAKDDRIVVIHDDHTLGPQAKMPWSRIRPWPT